MSQSTDVVCSKTEGQAAQDESEIEMDFINSDCEHDESQLSTWIR